jgi:hypothetical protein
VRKGGKTKRAAGNPLSAGGSQGPLFLPKAEDTGKVDHVAGESKFPGKIRRFHAASELSAINLRRLV